MCTCMIIHFNLFVLEVMIRLMINKAKLVSLAIFILIVRVWYGERERTSDPLGGAARNFTRERKKWRNGQCDDVYVINCNDNDNYEVLRPQLPEIEYNQLNKRFRSACIGRAATPCALIGAIPLLPAADTLSCWISPLARFASPQTTWCSQVPPGAPYWRQA